MQTLKKWFEFFFHLHKSKLHNYSMIFFFICNAFKVVFLQLAPYLNSFKIRKGDRHGFFFQHTQEVESSVKFSACITITKYLSIKRFGSIQLNNLAPPP